MRHWAEKANTTTNFFVTHTEDGIPKHSPYLLYLYFGVNTIPSF